MRRMSKTASVLLVVGLLLAGSPLYAGDFAKVGTTGSDFLKIPIGTRGVAMGNGFSALSNDITAMFWNPAGLTNMKGKGVYLERINWLADISYNAVGVAYNLNPFWAVGVFGAVMNSGDIPVTTVEQQNGTGETFSVNNFVAGVSIASKLTDKFSFGANIKYVHEDLDKEISGSYAVDVGTIYDTRWNTMRISMNIRNFGPEIQLAGEYHDWDNGAQLPDPQSYLAYHFPMVFRLGVALDPIQSATNRLTVVGELEHPNDNVERINVGGEYAFQEMFFLRGGYTFNHDSLGMSAGVGAKFAGFEIDYTISDFSVLDLVHRFSIQFGF
ncbi:MAG: PorV/PorQ family protein [bacterium]